MIEDIEATDGMVAKALCTGKANSYNVTLDNDKVHGNITGWVKGPAVKDESGTIIGYKTACALNGVKVGITVDTTDLAKAYVRQTLYKLDASDLIGVKVIDDTFLASMAKARKGREKLDPVYGVIANAFTAKGIALDGSALTDGTKVTATDVQVAHRNDNKRVRKVYDRLVAMDI